MKKYNIRTPKLIEFLFGDWRMAWVWFAVRIYVGYQWLSAGFDKITGSGWVGVNAGNSLRGFINNAITLTKGAHPSVQIWYADFLKAVVLPHVVAWGYVIAIGEFLVGIALIIGIFTGLAAFFGSFMNFNYLMAGSISINPYLLVLGILLVVAWKVSGFLGLDFWIIKFLFSEKPLDKT